MSASKDTRIEFPMADWHTTYLSRLPRIFPGAPLKSMGLTEISRVIWQLWYFFIVLGCAEVFSTTTFAFQWCIYIFCSSSAGSLFPLLSRIQFAPFEDFVGEMGYTIYTVRTESLRCMYYLEQAWTTATEDTFREVMLEYECLSGAVPLVFTVRIIYQLTSLR